VKLEVRGVEREEGVRFPLSSTVHKLHLTEAMPGALLLYTRRYSSA
jgi:hypothetical protein